MNNKDMAFIGIISMLSGTLGLLDSTGFWTMLIGLGVGLSIIAFINGVLVGRKSDD